MDIILLFLCPETHIYADTDFPIMNKLYIDGTLELVDDRNFSLTATYIIIRGGRLIIGQNETHGFQHDVTITLTGNIFTPELRMPGGSVNVGAKAIGKFLKVHFVIHSLIPYFSPRKLRFLHQQKSELSIFLCRHNNYHHSGLCNITIQ